MGETRATIVLAAGAIYSSRTNAGESRPCSSIRNCALITRVREEGLVYGLSVRARSTLRPRTCDHW